MTNTNSQSVNETFIKNMEEQLNVAKREALTPEKRKEEFQRIKKTIEDYKNKRNLTPEELAKFEAIFAKIEEEYRKLNSYIQSQVAHIKISQEDGPKQMDNLRKRAESKYYEITGKNKTNPEKNGEENESRFKKGLSFVVQIANMDFKELGKSPENEKFVKDLPAVRGMAGAIVLKDLHERGYKISFEKDGKIKLEGRNSDNNAASLILNEQIERNPELGKILKEGLLFLDGDIQRYAAIYTDENGKNLDTSKMTAEKYLDYLKNRNDKGAASLADGILLKNPRILDGMNLPEMAKSSQHLTPVLEKITQEVIQNQAKSTVNAQSNSTENTTIDTKTAREYYGKIADEVANLNWKENPVGSTAKAGYMLLVDGTSAVFKDINESIKNSSNEEVAGAVILFILSSVFVGFKKTLWGALGFAALGLGYKHTKEQLNGTIKSITTEQKEKQAERIHTPEKVNEALPITAQFRQSKLNDLNQYYKDGKGNLNEDLKKKLEDKKTKEYVKKEVDTANKGVEKVIAKTGSQLDEATKKEIKENITLQNALDLENATPEQLISQVIKVIEQAIKEATDPKIRASLEELLKYLKEVDSSSIDWETIKTIALIIATFGTVATVALIKLGLLGFTKIPRKLAWKVTGGIINTLKKQGETKTNTTSGSNIKDAVKKGTNTTKTIVTDGLINTLKNSTDLLREKLKEADRLELDKKLKEIEIQEEKLKQTTGKDAKKLEKAKLDKLTTDFKFFKEDLKQKISSGEYYLTDADRKKLNDLKQKIEKLKNDINNSNGNEKTILEKDLKIKEIELRILQQNATPEHMFHNEGVVKKAEKFAKLYNLSKPQLGVEIELTSGEKIVLNSNSERGKFLQLIDKVQTRTAPLTQAEFNQLNQLVKEIKLPNGVKIIPGSTNITNANNFIKKAILK